MGALLSTGIGHLGVMAYGETREQAITNVEALALRVITAFPLWVACWLYRIQTEVSPYVLSARDSRLLMKGRNMKTRVENARDELRPEYDFDYSKAVRGKYYRRLLEEGANVVVLEPDVAKAFRDSAAVNEALRSLLDFACSTQHLTKGSARRAKTAPR
jgi:hypothetical protein